MKIYEIRYEVRVPLKIDAEDEPLLDVLDDETKSMVAGSVAESLDVALAENEYVLASVYPKGFVYIEDSGQIRGAEA